MKFSLDGHHGKYIVLFLALTKVSRSCRGGVRSNKKCPFLQPSSASVTWQPDWLARVKICRFAASDYFYHRKVMPKTFQFNLFWKPFSQEDCKSENQNQCFYQSWEANYHSLFEKFLPQCQLEVQDLPLSWREFILQNLITLTETYKYPSSTKSLSGCCSLVSR